ncbi:transmembrane protein [Mycobacterium lentiflavum]|uniref:Transmembrane protein n=1 Tax=Mycobacterium lentiflavum TaxID=141349 RepID=A0A0E4GVW0_MYCLN|nr:transmembrane protein [Mycobacterium lentiflavum]
MSLFGFVLLGESAAPLKTPDLNAADDTVVLLRVEELKTVANRLGVKVLVYPQEAMWDSRLDVLKQDTAVRMDPPNDLGDLVYPAGKSPAQVATTVEAHGDPEIWPFDSYETDTLSADVLVGSGDDRKYKPARIEVAGKLEGWDVSVQRVGEGGDSVIITLQRSKAPLIFDLGICLVLFAMPTIALAVVIPMVIGKRKVVPPFGGWFAALLFAVIPIRNFLPGAPPPGAWIDQALVIWVLIALVGAMGLYMLAWYRRSD